MSTLQLVHGGLEELRIINVGLWEDLDLDAQSTAPAAAADNELHQEQNNSRTICLLEVPAFMIPKDILMFFGTAVQDFVSFKVLRRFSCPGKYAALLQLRSVDCARALLRDYHGQPLCSLEPTTCWLHAVRDLTEPSGTGDRDGDSGSSSCRDQKISTEEIPHGTGMERLLVDLGGAEQCPLCLEPLAEGSGIFTTCCGHSFHVACMCQLSAPQCPVCRFQHDSDAHSMSECSTCGWGGSASSSGSRSNQLSLTRARAAAAAGAGGDMNVEFDLWVCLICGYLGCGRSNAYHIGAHYSEHLHAYAMNVESKRVWDFAGDGYVHRLILHRPDPEDAAAAADLPAIHTKLSEVTDPDHPTGNVRSRRAELSQEEEDNLVSSKLERTAESYNRILTWQLLQHRELYEARVKMVQAFALPGSQRQGAAGTGQRSFSEAVMLSLDMESDKAKKMTETARARLHAAQEELDLLNKLHASLVANEQDWQRKVSAADALLQGMEKKCREGIPKLEKTVASLMQRMDKQDAEEAVQQAEDERRAAAVLTAGSSSSGAGAGGGAKSSSSSSGGGGAGIDLFSSTLPAPADDTSDNANTLTPPLLPPPSRPPRLLRRIPSDYAELNALHALYPFVPSSEQVRPTAEVKEQKAIALGEITATWRDFVDFIYHTVFNCPYLETDDKQRVVASRHRRTVATEKRTSFKPNIFPYQCQGQHYVMWYGDKDQQRSDEQISSDISHELTAMLGKDKFDFAWYINPKMTVPELFHVQVFWAPWAPSCEE